MTRPYGGMAQLKIQRKKVMDAYKKKTVKRFLKSNSQKCCNR
jgi:hypothetical protein